MIKGFEKNVIDKNKFISTIKNLKCSNNVIDFYVKKNLKKNCFFSKKENKIILNNYFFNQPHEIIFRSFSDSIKIIGRRYYSTRGKKLDNIIKRIINNATFKGTLGGCIIEKVNQTVIITKNDKIIKNNQNATCLIHNNSYFKVMNIKNLAMWAIIVF